MGYDFVDGANLSSENYNTEYNVLVRNTLQDPEGVTKTLDVVKETLNKGKKSGLLSI